jgi:hypothetical protein
MDTKTSLASTETARKNEKTKPTPNAECFGCGVPLSVSAEHLADEDAKFRCFSCCFGAD